MQFSLTEKFDLCGPTFQLGLGSRLRLSLFLCIFIGFVQLSSLDLELVAQILRIRRIARSQQIEFTFPWTYKAHRRPRSNFLRSFLLLLLPLLLLCHCARPACSLSLHMNGQLHARSTLSPRGTSHVSLCCAALCASIAKGRGCFVGCVRRASQFMT